MIVLEEWRANPGFFSEPLYPSREVLSAHRAGRFEEGRKDLLSALLPLTLPRSYRMDSRQPRKKVEWGQSSLRVPLL